MLEPILHRIIVKTEKFDDFDDTRKKARALGFALPDSDKRADASVDKGTVLAIGPTAFRDFGTECPIKIGDKVAFARFSGKIISDNEEDFVVLNDEDICCVYKD